MGSETALVDGLAGLPWHVLLLGISAGLAVAVLIVLSRPTETWYRQLRSRLLFGVPWGTLLVMAGLLVVYYGLQDGLTNPSEPVVIPFRAWSYFDPFGMVLASFSHASLGHLIGNLLGTLIFGSLAEYAWGHHTNRRTETVWQTLWTDPVVRAVGVFPTVVVLVGLAGSMVALGPIIGFSTVVFAFAGFTLVQYPLTTVIASVAQGVVSTLFTAIRLPQQVAVAEATYSVPWFASIAVQGHAVGLFLGVLLGIGLQQYRSTPSPPATRVWLGVLLFSMSRSLWAVYWYRGNDVYVLYRALGAALVFLLVIIVTYAVVAPNRPLFPSRAVPNPQTVRSSLVSITSREVGLALVVCAAAALAGPAIAANLTTTAEADLPGDPIEIRGYEITYAEDVPDGQLAVFDIDAFGETTQLNTSGVIVRNTDRHLWATAVSRGALADSGSRDIRLGGLGWQETVTADRTGWTAVGGSTAYRVSLTHDDEKQLAYTSEPAQAEPVIAGANVSVHAADDGFRVGLTTDEETRTAAIPAENETIQLGAVEFVRTDDRLFAVHNETRVRVAQREH